jgi:hypothetical protein
MTTATIVKLKALAAKPARSRAATRKLRRQAVAAVGVGGVACVLTALSLNHLARGIGMVTGSAEWEAWSIAAGIDLGFVSLELAQLGGHHRNRAAGSATLLPARDHRHARGQRRTQCARFRGPIRRMDARPGDRYGARHSGPGVRADPHRRDALPRL